MRQYELQQIATVLVPPGYDDDAYIQERGAALEAAYLSGMESFRQIAGCMQEVGAAKVHDEGRLEGVVPVAMLQDSAGQTRIAIARLEIRDPRWHSRQPCFEAITQFSVALSDGPSSHPTLIAQEYFGRATLPPLIENHVYLRGTRPHRPHGPREWYREELNQTYPLRRMINDGVDTQRLIIGGLQKVYPGEETGALVPGDSI